MKEDKTANLGVLAYSVGISIGGVVLGAVTYAQDWDGGVYILAGILSVAGVSMLVGRMRGGVKLMRFTCPSCQESQLYAASKVTDGSMYPCTGCARYLRTVEGLPAALPLDTELPERAFETPLPRNPVLSAACIICGGASTGDLGIGGTWKMGKTTVTRTMRVSVCDEHAHGDPIALAPADQMPGDLGLSLTFKSYAAMLRFREDNPSDIDVVGAMTFEQG